MPAWLQALINLRFRDLHALFDRTWANYRVVNTFVTVGVASATLIQGNENRKGLTLSNSGPGAVWGFKGTGPAVVGTGFLIPNGGFATDSPDTLGYLYRGPYTFISTIAATNLGVVED